MPRLSKNAPTMPASGAWSELPEYMHEVIRSTQARSPFVRAHCKLALTHNTTAIFRVVGYEARVGYSVVFSVGTWPTAEGGHNRLLFYHDEETDQSFGLDKGNQGARGAEPEWSAYKVARAINQWVKPDHLVGWEALEGMSKRGYSQWVADRLTGVE